TASSDAVYRRIILKCSGEGLGGLAGVGFDPEALARFESTALALASTGTQIGIVVGGGNILSGPDATSIGISRVDADEAGMLATAVNAKILAGVLRKTGSRVRVMSPFALGNMAEQHDPHRAHEYLDDGEILVFACGMGHPYVTTDY